MAGYLVYRPQTLDKNKLPYDIQGMLVNGADATAARAAAVLVASRLCGSVLAAEVNAWTADQLNGSDFTAAQNGVVFQGEVIYPGSKMRGGGLTV